jgi:hypothetical protein
MPEPEAEQDLGIRQAGGWLEAAVAHTECLAQPITERSTGTLDDIPRFRHR